MSRALEKWFGDGLEAGFPESDEQKREREAAEEFGELIAKGAAPVRPEEVEERTDEDEQPQNVSPFANLPLSWASST